MPLLSTYQSSLSFHAILSTYAKKPLPSIHLKVVHTHWSKLFNFQLFLIVSFYKSLHYAPYILQTLHNICIISRLKSLQSPINTGLIYPDSSSLGRNGTSFTCCSIICQVLLICCLKPIFRLSYLLNVHPRSSIICRNWCK